MVGETVLSSPEGVIRRPRSVVQFEGHTPRPRLVPSVQRSQTPRNETPSQQTGILRSSSAPRSSHGGGSQSKRVSTSKGKSQAEPLTPEPETLLAKLRLELQIKVNRQIITHNGTYLKM